MSTVRPVTQSLSEGQTQKVSSYTLPASYKFFYMFGMILIFASSSWEGTTFPALTSLRIPTYLNLLSLAVMSFLIVVRLVYSDGDFRPWLFLVFGVAAALMLYRYAHTLPLALVLLVFCGRGIRVEAIIKVYLYCSIILVLITVSAACLKVIPSFIGPTGASSFGFIYLTDLSDRFLFIYISILLLTRKRHPFGVFLLGMGFAAISVYLTSTLDLVLSLTLLGLYFLNRRRKRRDSLRLRRYGQFVFPGLVVLSVLMAYSYSSESVFWLQLNKLFVNRPMLMNSAVRNYPITIFGQLVPQTGTSYFTVHASNPQPYFFIDNSFLRVLLMNGIAGLTLIFALYTLLIRKAIQANDDFFLAIIIVVLVSAFVDWTLIHIEFNIFPILGMTLIESRHRRQEEVMGSTVPPLQKRSEQGGTRHSETMRIRDTLGQETFSWNKGY